VRTPEKCSRCTESRERERQKEGKGSIVAVSACEKGTGEEPKEDDSKNSENLPILIHLVL
jgi:hypothetical protein